MLHSTERRQLRQTFFDVWQQHQTKCVLEPLEKQVLQVILDHPEYHAMLDQPDKYIDKDYLPEFGQSNPFLHMSAHLGLREQINTDRPEGIRAIFKILKNQFADHLPTEHVMMECLMQIMLQAGQSNRPPDEAAYLHALEKLVITT